MKIARVRGIMLGNRVERAVRNSIMDEVYRAMHHWKGFEELSRMMLSTQRLDEN